LPGTDALAQSIFPGAAGAGPRTVGDELDVVVLLGAGPAAVDVSGFGYSDEVPAEPE
jgi:hypothetical protein